MKNQKVRAEAFGSRSCCVGLVLLHPSVRRNPEEVDSKMQIKMEV